MKWVVETMNNRKVPGTERALSFSINESVVKFFDREDCKGVLLAIIPLNNVSCMFIDKES